MRKLNRAAVPAPPCLGGYQHGTHNWADVSPEHRAEIRAQLETMQGKRCAYCEGDIEVLGQHIEHFRRKGDPAYRHLTFDWNNLYWSCGQNDSCGHFKDTGAGPYNVAHLIDPCLHDPDGFFVFRSDGTVSLRPGLSEQDEHRAKETLRVFSLDADRGRLRAMRKAAVSGYVADADEAANAGLSPEDIREYFADVLEYAKSFPFFTAIKHVLTES
ncbi:retron system putative HNH endonuclease [Sphingomonas desiccabilis]|uniref:TIGR02646 family protein n=1 Tax=Sphingomonas desiccabilis TaxID=429134 RepID=A0A4Q2IYT9_9SPHN|nr:retron system putative HNH endonuclease [Sphingomonas desiccabilis]MBB3909721.1 uncharacterized protein (TIGR02646 family) [Sphingomonas desiccabilis]RXZ34414.1 TIGR02646 family protein [Sphingomonas desiccabilis]